MQKEYKNMVASTANNGASYIEAEVGALEVGDVVTRIIKPRSRGGFRASRSAPMTSVETYVVTGFGSEFYSEVLGLDAVRAYCTKTVENIKD